MVKSHLDGDEDHYGRNRLFVRDGWMCWAPVLGAVQAVLPGAAIKIMWYAVLCTLCIWYSNTLIVAIPTFFIARPLGRLAQMGWDILTKEIR